MADNKPEPKPKPRPNDRKFKWAEGDIRWVIPPDSVKVTPRSGG